MGGVASTAAATKQPLWYIACSAIDVTSNQFEIKCTDLHSESKACPFEDGPICLVLEGHKRHIKPCNLQNLKKLINYHMHVGSRIVIKTCGKRDKLMTFATWDEFQPLALNPTCFANFELEVADELAKIIFHSGSVIPLTDATPATKVHFELGDHADDDIQRESSRRKKIKPVEDGTDDCGDDVSHLDLPDLTGLSMLFSDVDEISNSDSEGEDMFSGSFFVSHFWGSDDHDYQAPSTNFSQAYASLNKTASEGAVDFFELFGGKGGVTLISIRRYNKDLRPGRNFDITAQIDLSDKHEVDLLMHYIETCKPLVAVMGPPCTAFGPWSSYNKVHAHAAWAESFQIGKPLADLAAKIAETQMNNQRFFLCENPWSSKLWELPSWKRVLSHPTVVFSYADQCAYGLVSIEGWPTQKPTCFVSNHPILIDRLKKCCTCKVQHVQLAGNAGGISRTSFAQTWPPKLCDAIAQSIMELKYLLYKEAKALSNSRHSVYPAVRKLTTCPGCKQNAAGDDTRHTREEDCRSKHIEPVNWLCPACSMHKHSSHRDHTHESGICRWADAPKRASSTRTTRPRGVHIPAHKVTEAEDSHNEIASNPRPQSNVGDWTALDNLEIITMLDGIKDTDGWHKIDDTYRAHVSSNSRSIRSAEPRLDNAQFPTRCTYGLFPDHAHSHGSWWQLQQDADSQFSLAIGYSVPLLIVLFKHVDATSDKIKPEHAGKPFQDWIDEYETSDVALDADKWTDKYPWASRKQTAAIPPKPVPTEIIDEGDEQEETTVDPLTAEEQTANPPDWTSWDLGRALRSLRGADQPAIVRTLRKLHMRWWHASKQRMHSLLAAAGVQKLVLDAIEGVVDTCKICRLWKRPTAKSVASLRLSTAFNETVQIDLLFIEQMIVLHAIDECTRWSAGMALKSKKPADILSGIVFIWFRLFGPPSVLIADHEGALMSEESAIFMERWGTSFKPKPKGSHAAQVERHHELVRNTFHKIKSQAITEGLQLSDEDVLAETMYAKNALIVVHGKTPYEAVLGRSPGVLKEFEAPSCSMAEDQLGGDTSRHATRLRELAIQHMVEGTARERLKRAAATQARPTGEMLELQPGDLVDIYRTPKTKDAVGWRGPATVLSVLNLPHGFVDVQWGGRALTVRIPDIRKALSYLTALDDGNTALEILRQFALTVVDRLVTCAYVLTPKGWQPSKSAAEHPEVLRAGIHVGYNSFGIRCTGVRIGHGQATLSGISGSTSTSVLMWYLATDPQGYRTLQVPGSAAINLKYMFGEAWLNYKFMQFISCSKETSKKLKLLMPDEPYLGQDPNPDNQHPQPPHQPDDDMPQPDEDMDEADELMPDQPYYPPPRPPPQPPRVWRQAVSTGSTRRSPMSTASSQISPPGPPPPKAPPPGRILRSPVDTRMSSAPSTLPDNFPPPPASGGKKARIDQTSPVSTHRSRTPYPTAINQAKAHSKSSALAKALAKSAGMPGSSTDNVGLNMRSPSNSTLPSTVPFSPIPSNLPSNTSNHEPVLPFADTASEAESDASTVLVEDFHASKPSRPRMTPSYGKFKPSCGCSLEEAVQAQQAYLQEAILCEGPMQMRSSSSTDDYLEIEFSPEMAKLVIDAPPVAADEVLVVFLSKTGANKKKMMVEKNYDNLSAADVRRDWHLVEPAIRKEVKCFDDNGTFTLQLRSEAHNVCSSRWVFKYKSIDNVRTVKARLTIRGFEDMSVSEDNYAGTATRWSQRVIASVAVQRVWRIFVTDVSTAFLRSMSFSDMAKDSGGVAREVSFVPPIGSEMYFKELPKMRSYDPLTYVLRLLKPVYGLKDAPAAWKKQLNRVLLLAGGKQLHTDKCLWAWFDGVGCLQLLLSTHVDDLKGCGDEATTTRVLNVLTKEFGTLKTQFDDFTHCGIKHETNKQDRSITLHQHEYAQQLILMDAVPLLAVSACTPLTATQHAQYLSSLGGVSWLVQTRTDICVYVCALQRAAKAPQVQHALRLIKVCKWVKRKKSHLLFKKLRTPTRVVAPSDSAFRKEDTKGLAMRGALIMVCEDADSHPGGNCHILEWYARKQRRVTRSTFSAELNAASDAYEFAKLIAMTLAECIRPYPSIQSLVALEENGDFPVPIHLIVDARSVFDALKASEIKAPSEISLIMFLCQLKEALLCHALSRLWWCDTHDMVADGLNKGAVSRQALLDLVNTGSWNLNKPAVSHTESRYIPIASQQSLVGNPTDTT